MVLDVFVVVFFLSWVNMSCPCHYKCSIATCHFILYDVGDSEFCVVECDDQFLAHLFASYFSFSSCGRYISPSAGLSMFLRYKHLRSCSGVGAQNRKIAVVSVHRIENSLFPLFANIRCFTYFNMDYIRTEMNEERH